MYICNPESPTPGDAHFPTFCSILLLGLQQLAARGMKTVTGANMDHQGFAPNSCWMVPFFSGILLAGALYTAVYTGSSAKKKTEPRLLETRRRKKNTLIEGVFFTALGFQIILRQLLPHPSCPCQSPHSGWTVFYSSHQMCRKKRSN